MTFGEIEIGSRFVFADSPGGAIKIKTGFARWKWADHEGFTPVAVRCRSDREILPAAEAPPVKS